MSLIWRWLRGLRDDFREWWDVPPKPLMVIISQKRESTMGLKFKATLPAPGASDVTTRKLSVTENGTEKITDLDGKALTAEFVVARDAAVSVKLSDVDGSGNQSPWSDPAEFTATDTFAPPTPNGISIEAIGQVDD